MSLIKKIKLLNTTYDVGVNWSNIDNNPITGTIGNLETPIYISSGTIAETLPVQLLTNRAAIAANASLNDYTNLGNYYISSSSISPTITEGKPKSSNLYGALKVSKSMSGTSGGGYLRQDWFDYNSPQHYMRTSDVNGNWSSWKAYAYVPGDSTTLITADVGSTTQPIYALASGKLEACSYTLESNVASGTAKYFAFYSSANQLETATDTHINTTNLSGSTKGYVELVLGSNANRYGRLALYGKTAGNNGSYVSPNNPSGWINHILPDTAGWLVTAGNGSSTGAGAADRPIYVATTGVATEGEYMLPRYHSDLDFTDTNPNPGVYRMQTTHPVTGVTEYGSVLSLTKTSATGKGYDAQMIISSASGSNIHHVYVRRLMNTPSWLSWTKVLTEHDISSIYWGNIATTSSATYNKAPELATLKLNGNTSASSASTKNVQLIYNSSLEVLNFVFT